MGLRGTRCYVNLLFSTNVYLKFLVQKIYANDVHYVWCSDTFDCTKAGPHTLTSRVAPTSDPKSLFLELRRGSLARDKHHTKINEQKASIFTRAKDWLSAGKITQDQLDEIVLLGDDWDNLRPVVYIIPASDLEKQNRVHPVPVAKRAAVGPEYTVHDLKGAEFQIIDGL